MRVGQQRDEIGGGHLRQVQRERHAASVRSRPAQGQRIFPAAGRRTCDRPSVTVLSYYRAQCERADAIVAGVSLSDAPRGKHGGDVVPNVREVILPMIEETAAHTGHLEVARELLDGTTGRGRR
ncbi:MAG TPA: DUF664 domain-containing protein [Trebonia sp.]|nr:DUF664 domain-containing protein [Trebonia sp.]